MMPVQASVATLALPSAPLLLESLGAATLAIHLLFMNVALGGTLLAAVYAVKGKERHLQAGFGLARALPFAMAYAVAFGVAPLLFVQALYGRFFYTAAILMAPLYLAIVPVLVAAYWAVYFLAWRWETLKWGRLAALAAVFMALCYVGFVQANLFTLMCDPAHFREMYLSRPGGFHLNGSDVTILPRFLHVIFGAMAVAALVVAMQGLRKLKYDPEQGRWQYRSGATWFACCTMANMAVGSWWLMDLAPAERSLFTGGNAWATGVFGTALLLAVASLVLSLAAIGSPKPGGIFALAASATLLTVLGMVLMRAMLRDSVLRPFYEASDTAAPFQWWAAGLFALVFIAGLGVMAYLGKVAIKAFPRHEGPPLGSGGYRIGPPGKH